MATPGGEIGGASAVLGQVAFVKLAPQFKDAKWREALIISSGSSSGWCRAAVRAVNRQEIDEGLSSVKVGGETFFVLECPIHQLRVGCDERCLKLRAESSEIMSAVRELLTSGESDLQFATASEPDQRSRRRVPVEKAEESSSSNSSDSNDALEDWFKKAKKNWQGGGIGSEKLQETETGYRKSKRFPLLEKKPEEKKKPGLDHAQLLEGLKMGEDPLRTLVTLQLAQSLGNFNKSGRKQRDQSHSSATSDSAESESGSERSSRRRTKGHARAIEDYRAGKRRMFKKPMKYVRKYVRETERNLGAVDRPFRLSEAGRKVSWGKQKSLQRVHYMMSEILELLLKNKVEKACLQTVLCLRSIHQAAIDQDWAVAWMITHLDDPFTRQRWGGDAEELGHIAAYLKSMAELEKNTEKVRSQAASSSVEKPDHPNPKDPPKKFNKKKGNGKGEEVTEGA